LLSLRKKLRSLADNYYDFASEQAEDAVHYVFSTASGVIYSVYFNPAEFSDYLDELPYLSKSGCLFGFFPLDDNGDKRKADRLISATLYKILEDYFESFGSNRVLLFHCDNEDGMQKGRDKLFDIWFKKKPTDLLIHKEGLEVKIPKEDGSTKTEYLGFIIHGNNKQLLEIVKSEFIDISAMLITRKR
jgi:hypothetical protein